MAGRQRDLRTGRYTSGSVEGSKYRGTEGTSLVDVWASQRMSRNPSAQSSRRNSPEGRGLRRQLDWIMEDILPRLDWKKDPEEVGIILEDLPEEEQVRWAAVQSVFLEERTSGQNTKRIEEYKEEIKGCYGPQALYTSPANPYVISLNPPWFILYTHLCSILIT